MDLQAKKQRLIDRNKLVMTDERIQLKIQNLIDKGKLKKEKIKIAKFKEKVK